jgi:hypothetical protein
MIRGTKLAIGTLPLGVSRPTSPVPHPSWKQRVTIPKAAETESTLAIAAWIETTIDRKAIVSTRKPSATTAAITSIRVALISLARST